MRKEATTKIRETKLAMAQLAGKQRGGVGMAPSNSTVATSSAQQEGDSSCPACVPASLLTALFHCSQAHHLLLSCCPGLPLFLPLFPPVLASNHTRPAP